MIFQIRKYFTLLYVFIISKIKPWKKVEGIFLPVNINIGFNVLRWILNERYEDGEINIIKNRITSGDIVLEIGTGLGFISSFCSKKIGAENVFTYEANILNLPVIKSVFRKNEVSPNLTNGLLSNTDGEFLFPINAKNRLGSGTAINTDKKAIIPMINLNGEIKKINPTFLIMDIEGGEYEIFSIIDFQSIKKIQFELHPEIIGKEKCHKIFEILDINNFKKDEIVSSGVNFYFYR